MTFIHLFFIVCISDFLPEGLGGLRNLSKMLKPEILRSLVMSLLKFRSPALSILPTRVGKFEASDPLIKAYLADGTIPDNHIS